MTGFLILKVLHLVAAAVWIGGSLTAPSDIRRCLLAGPPHTAQLMPRLRAISKLMNMSALFTFITGVALVFAAGGFDRVPHRIHVGIFLTLAAVVAGRWLIRPVLKRIAAVIGAPVPPVEVDRIMVQFWAVNGVEHALRLAVLVLMVYPFAF
jgi:uncharacterized membrane protein